MATPLARPAVAKDRKSMRPGQQNNNKRMRGRGRKGPNPLSRSYESNGPDVKIRGTAQHIAERYATLARDATSAGDRVMAENYFQHAEHYGRIVAAAQGSFQPAQIERDYDETDEDAEGGEDFANGGRQDDRNGNNGQYRDRNDNQQRGENHQRRDREDNRDYRGERQDRDGRDARGDRENGRDQQRDNRGQREGRDGRDRNFRDRRDQNGQPYGRDRNEGGEDRGHRNERRFENRDRRDEGETSSVSAEESAAPAAEFTAPVEANAPRVDESSFDEAPARRRARTPRARLNETSGEEPVNAEIPSNGGESPATVSADSSAAEEVVAPRRRGRPRKAESAEDAAPEAGAEAPVKRKPGRPRKVKAEDEGGEGSDKSELPAFLLASNG